MSLKNRKFSLDSSVSQDATGSISNRRGSTHRLLKKYRTSQEDSELEIPELNQNSNGNFGGREKTSVEEIIERQDGLISNNSFHKHNRNFHRLFKEIPEGENLTHTFTCALQKEVLYHGKLYISENNVCFFSSVLLKETKVVIPTSNIQEVKKQNAALSMLSIQTADDEKYFFVSLRNREMCYNLLQSVCSQAQVSVPSAKHSPHGSSAENEADSNLVSSHSSIDDTVDHHMSGQNGSTQRMSTTEEADGTFSSWLWKIMEDVTVFFFLRPRVNFSIVLFAYLMLLVLLLLVSGYIGLRMIALERQLSSLSELSLLFGDQQET
ncbi:GRAM domain-containing protein 3-like isoform X2 [Hippocampus comes]|uniref:GRAM domain-containing protein 3-like isoform X2 n=1 Tax=Hippocampus comes TaxID=109280 RepID=UPI00094F30BB|nr:PREDICTED: GRAM domain-containing protein 3-like isoform X2 [Hippocampus comes]